MQAFCSKQHCNHVTIQALLACLMLYIRKQYIVIENTYSLFKPSRLIFSVYCHFKSNRQSSSIKQCVLTKRAKKVR